MEVVHVAGQPESVVQPEALVPKPEPEGQRLGIPEEDPADAQGHARHHLGLEAEFRPHAGGLLLMECLDHVGGQKRVEKVGVTLGPDEFELERRDGRVNCRRRTVVRGISLKSEELSLEDWIDAVSRALVDEAAESERGRAALARLLDA